MLIKIISGLVKPEVQALILISIILKFSAQGTVFRLDHIITHFSRKQSRKKFTD